MSTDLQAEGKSQSFSLVPRNLEEAFRLAEVLANSDMVPKDYKGKPGNVLVAVQMGQELGLQPLASIQNIAVVNGKPGLYGDAGKALLLAAGCSIDEDDIRVIKERGYATCTITRSGRTTSRTYGIDNAKTARLWGKEGPWSTNPERQMAWRAFWFAARDAAADLLKGLGGAEELRDVEPKDMGSAEVVSTRPAQPAAPAALPEYPHDAFAQNLPKWADAIKAGKLTPEDAIKRASTKGVLTEAQKEEIRAAGKPNQPADPEIIDPPAADDDGWLKGYESTEVAQ